MKFPDHLLKTKKKTLGDLQLGEREAFPLYGIYIDKDTHDAYASTSVRLPPPIDENLNCGEIWR